MNFIWLTLRPLAMMFLLILLVLTISRLALVILWWPRVQAVDATSFVLQQGLRFDLVLLGMLLVIPLIIMPFLATSFSAFPFWKWLLSIYVPLMIMLVLFMELATPSFAEQFDARPNILFFEYFQYPREILSTLWGAYRTQLVVGLPIVLLSGFALFNYVLTLLEPAQPVSILVAIPLSIVLILISVLCARSTLDHRPVNPSTVAMTTDSLVNELPLSSYYTTAYAAYEMRHEDSGGVRYGEMAPSIATNIVRTEMKASNSQFIQDISSTWHDFTASRVQERPKNLVIILQESLGAEFVGSMGGLDLTPNIDALREQGLSFDRLYATGTRSVRGIEAVITGFLPTPSRSVVKLTKSQRNFFTLGSFLKDAGYDTSFIYGGKAHFDNMRRFFVNNGFDTIIDQGDYENPAFVGSWGVSDEDLMVKAHDVFSRKTDKPFFSLVFSSSNHTPFEFPDDKIELYDDQKQTVNNAVKYADYAVGQFFDKARSSSYWDDTVFLVVADHNSRVYGSDLVPVNRFHIPGIILGNSVEVRHESRVASQVDLAPTLLSLMGVSGRHPMPGIDFTTLPQSHPGRAIMQFNGIQAYMEGPEVVVLQRDLKPQGFLYDGHRLTQPHEPTQSLKNKAIAHATWAANAYKTGEYKVGAYKSTVANTVVYNK